MKMLTNKILVSLPVLFLTAMTSAAKSESPDLQDDVFAKVGSSVILVSEYKEALIRASRNTFYHATPPEEELLSFQQDVADMMIDRTLLLQQAEAQKLTISNESLEHELDKYRNRAQRRGQKIDEDSKLWKSLKKQTRKDLLIAKLEDQVRKTSASPSEEELKTYFEANIDKFTEPARFDLSTILLGVNPSAGSEAWEAARQEANDLVSRLRNGADFSELARIHSSDVSADQGGELGYSHKGMFSTAAQEVIEQLKPGEISDPLQVLEGIVIFRLHDRLPERIMAFSEVEVRVKEHWLRDEKEQHWQDYIKKLRESSTIEVAEKYLTISGKDDADSNDTHKKK